PSYRQGDSGPEVAALQERLIGLGFWLPGADGAYGSVTAQAVMAFQKSQGLGRDGIAGPVTRAALETAAPVGPREGGDHIEVDLERQLMFIVQGGRSHVFNTSTGMSGWRTPAGRFQITRQIDGVREAPLGDLYRPKYFNGGIALHGSPSIPGQPASHGCTRLHDGAVDFIWANGLAPVGTPVWVY
ncbi:MAG: L,D-transpeptidase family protein, partial [Acidimicrobiales bacterium]